MGKDAVPGRTRAHTVVPLILSSNPRSGNHASAIMAHTGVTIGNATSTMAESDEKGHSRIKATPWPRAASSSATEPPMLCPSKTTLCDDTPKPVKTHKNDGIESVCTAMGQTLCLSICSAKGDGAYHPFVLEWSGASASAQQQRTSPPRTARPSRRGRSQGTQRHKFRAGTTHCDTELS